MRGVTGDDLDDLKMDWDERKCQVQGLYESPDTPWVVRIEKYARKLDEAIEGDLESKMKSAFEAYYRQTRLRFQSKSIRISKTLPRRCAASATGYRMCSPN